MMDDIRVVYESRDRRACADRSLVLAAAQIPHQVVDDLSGYALVVPAEFSPRAIEELRLYDEENPPVQPPKPVVIEYQNAIPGIVGYVTAIILFAWLSWSSAWGLDWLTAGRIDGALVRSGEWWRTLTSLTMHGDLRHLVGNIIFGAFFGYLAGRLVGPGVAWLTAIAAAACGNLANTLLLESAHKSIGASTAVFAILGLTAGFAWRAKLFAQDRWSTRIGPIVGGLALLMYTGTGGDNTDIGAHLMGFVFGFLGGMLLTRFRERFQDAVLQNRSALVTVAALALAWIAAFGG
jgi:membrane associated rhomboid family serine protease